MDTRLIDNVREMAPLIHCITNYVTVNDVANMILATGASPIMSDGIREVEDVTSLCHALVINIGTLNERTIDSMLLAGKKAAECGHPVIFDPVGAGASAFRTETARRILEEVPVSIVRGNVSEIRTLAAGIVPVTDSISTADADDRDRSASRGVDAARRDAVTEDSLPRITALAEAFAGEKHVVVAMTGAVDVVTDGREIYHVRNGHPAMSRITGTGCMLDGVVAAYAAAWQLKAHGGEMTLCRAAALAVAAQGLCGELAYAKTEENAGGTASMRMYLIDAMSRMDSETLAKGMRIARSFHAF